MPCGSEITVGEKLLFHKLLQMSLRIQETKDQFPARYDPQVSLTRSLSLSLTRISMKHHIYEGLENLANCLHVHIQACVVECGCVCAHVCVCAYMCIYVSVRACVFTRAEVSVCVGMSARACV